MSAPALINGFQISAHFIFESAMEYCCFFGYQTILVGVYQLLIEAMPTEGLAGLDHILEAAIFLLAVNDRFTRTEVASHYFGDEVSAALVFTHQPLAHDVAHCFRETLADEQFLVFAEHSQD